MCETNGDGHLKMVAFQQGQIGTLLREISSGSISLQPGFTKHSSGVRSKYLFK